MSLSQQIEDLWGRKPSDREEVRSWPQPIVLTGPYGRLQTNRVFYQNGKVNACNLSQPSTVRTPHGVCQVNSGRVYFHENGRIACLLDWSRQLSVRDGINGEWHKHDVLFWTPSGELLTEDMPYVPR